MKGHYLDTKHPVVVENLMGIKRRKGTVQKGKKPILISELRKILKVIDEQNIEDIKKLRDKSIILIGFSGGFRRNEIVSLDCEDLDFVYEGLQITVKRSKTDQFEEGSIKALPYFKESLYCPVTIKKEYFKIKKGGQKIFKRVKINKL